MKKSGLLSELCFTKLCALDDALRGVAFSAGLYQQAYDYGTVKVANPLSILKRDTKGGKYDDMTEDEFAAVLQETQDMAEIFDGYFAASDAPVVTNVVDGVPSYVVNYRDKVENIQIAVRSLLGQVDDLIRLENCLKDMAYVENAAWMDGAKILKDGE